MFIGKGGYYDMYFLYILQSLKNNRYYIGSTNNLERRLVEHNSGKTQSLKFIRPLKLVFQKEYTKEQDARAIERKLKKLKSKTILEKIIQEQDIKLGP